MIKPSKEERVQFFVDYQNDTAFSAHARLLQSKWREGKGFPKLEYGNHLETEFAKESKANFLTDNIRRLVEGEIVKARANGGLISEPRIWNNLLSSQPLCFNLFGEMHCDLDLASNYFRKLFPEKVERVTSIQFEYSPGRGNLDYTGDNSAFDVFIEYTKGGKNGFIGIEVKYSENMKEESKEKAATYFKDRYEAITNESGKFKEGSIAQLRVPPLSQIWRDHLLSIATKKDYDDGFFVFLYPSQNKECDGAVKLYLEQLNTKDAEESGFYPRHLEDFLFTLHDLVETDWSQELIHRYMGDIRGD